jgi:hypothetical protein
MAISNLSSGFRPGVCTSTTRPAEPYEGMMIYETDTNRVLVWDNAAWVMIVSANTPPGLELISLGTVTSATSFQITGFSSSYDAYQIKVFLRRTDTVGATTLYAQLYNGATQRSTSYYGSAFFSSYLGTTGVGYTSNNSSNFFFFNADSGVSNGHGIGVYEVSGFNNSTFNFVGQHWDVQNARTYQIGAYHNVAETNDRLNISVTTGQVSGNWIVYGYRK